jgi:hypothetical protein
MRSTLGFQYLLFLSHDSSGLFLELQSSIFFIKFGQEMPKLFTKNFKKIFFSKEISKTSSFQQCVDLNEYSFTFG